MTSHFCAWLQHTGPSRAEMQRISTAPGVCAPRTCTCTFALSVPARDELGSSFHLGGARAARLGVGGQTDPASPLPSRWRHARATPALAVGAVVNAASAIARPAGRRNLAGQSPSTATSRPAGCRERTSLSGGPPCQQSHGRRCAARRDVDVHLACGWR